MTNFRMLADTPSPDFHRSPHRACRGENPNLFFPVSAVGVEAQMAKAICASCPFVQDCLLWALPIGNLGGIWGGTTEDERTQLRKRPAALALIKAAKAAPANRPAPAPAPADTAVLELNRDRVEALRAVQLKRVRLHADGRAMGTSLQMHGQYNNRRCYRVTELVEHGLIEVGADRIYRLTAEGARRLADHLLRSAA